MTTFLHTADLHLNCQRRRYPTQYLKRAAWVLEAIERTAADYEVDCIVVAGDVFQHPNLTIAERQLLSDWLGQLETPVLMISGNHDCRQPRTFGDTCLSYLSALQLNLHLIHDGGPRFVRAFDCCWILMPYYRWTHQEFRLIVESMVERIRRKLKDCPIVVVAHEAVYGATTDRGLEITQAQQIKLTQKTDVQYWALGDMHGPQVMLPNACYSGAPHQTTFGETVESKGCLIVDTDDPTNPQLVELESPYPLLSLDAPPAGDWPEFVRFTAPLPKDVLLPEHVLYEPPPRQQVEVSQTKARVPLYHGLQNHLEAQELSDELVERALGFADRMAEDLGIETGEVS